MKHYHFEVQAFNGKTPLKPAVKGAFNMQDVTVVDIIALSEEEALKKAKPLNVKKYYRVGKVYECHASEQNPQLGQDMQMAQIEIQKKMYDLIKGGHGS